MEKNFIFHAPICCNIGILLDLFRLYPNAKASSWNRQYAGNTSVRFLERLSRARIRDRRKLQVSVFPLQRKIREGIRSDGDRTSRPLARRRHSRIFHRYCPPPLVDGFRQPSIRGRLIPSASRGPTHFPFLGSRAVHFPDVPPVPAVKCQYGTYPRTKASLVRQ